MWSFFVKHSKFTLVILLAVTVLGTLSALTIDKEANPEVNVPFVIVSTAFPGANALDVEQFVTNPLEDAFAGLDDLRNLTSTSSLGFSSVALEFEVGTDIDKKMRDIQDAITVKKSELPSEATDPVAQQVRFDDRPIKVYAIGGPLKTVELKALADELANRLERIPGLTDAKVIGGEERQVRVLVNTNALAQYGLVIDQVINAIRQSNSNIPVGVIERDAQQYSVQFNGSLENIDEIAGLPVSTKDGHVVFVRDVAKVEDDFTERSSSSFLHKEGVSGEAVTIQIFKKSSGNVLKVVDAADQTIEDARGELLPEDVIIETVDDDAEFVRQDLGNLTSDGIQATLLVVFLLFFLLGWREALIAGLSVPLTYLISFLGLVSLGYTLNFLSLFSLILALGILIDSSIVMTEGIHENRMKGLSPLDAALKAVKDFEAPLTAGTFTTIFAFFPMIFTSGIIGEFIKSIPVTVTLVLLGAQVVALAFVPVMFILLMQAEGGMGRPPKYLSLILLLLGLLLLMAAGGLVSLIIGTIVALVGAYDYRTKRLTAAYVHGMVRGTQWFDATYARIATFRDAIMGRLRDNYANRVESIMGSARAQRRVALALVGGFMFAIALPIVGVLKVDMFPATDMDRIYVDVTLPSGSVLTSTEAIMEQVNAYLALQPEVKSYQISSGVGSGLSNGSGENIGSAVVNLVDRSDREDSRDLVTRYNRDLLPLVGNAKLIVQQLGSGPEAGSPVEVKIFGNDMTVLGDLALELEDVLKQIPGTQNVSSDVRDVPSEIVFDFDGARMGAYGVTPIQLASTLRTAVYGVEATSIRIDGEDIKVMVQYDVAESDARKDISVESIQSLTIQTQLGVVPLSTFVDTGVSEGRSFISHEDGGRVMRVTSGVTKGTVPQTIFESLQTKIDEMEVPEGYSIVLAGQNEDTNQSFADLGRAMFLGIFLIAALLVLEFNSYKQMFYILSSVPLALIGVFPGLALMQQPLSFPGMIGVVALSGIVVNNAILLIDRINENRRNNIEKRAAIMEACRSRMQPILLTAITTIVGLLPLAVTQPSWAPLGFAIIFGIAFSTILTLLVIPLLYLRYESN